MIEECGWGSDGQIVWDRDAPSGILTVEERLHGPDTNPENMERIVKQRTWPKGPEASLALFNMFGHGLISNTDEAETLPEDLGPDTDSLEPETIVVDKLSASAAQTNVVAAQPAD